MTQLLPIRFQEHLQVRRRSPPPRHRDVPEGREPVIGVSTSAFLSKHRTFSLPPHLSRSPPPFCLSLSLSFFLSLSRASVRRCIDGFIRPSLAPSFSLPGTDVQYFGADVTLTVATSLSPPPRPRHPRASHAPRPDDVTHPTQADSRLALRTADFVAQVIRDIAPGIGRDIAGRAKNRSVALPFSFPHRRADAIVRRIRPPRFRFFFYPKLFHLIGTHSSHYPNNVTVQTSRKMLLVPTLLST